MQTGRNQAGRGLSGTFISDWLVKDWDGNMWAQELAFMREIGMEYLILAPTVLHKTDGSWYTNYPTRLKGPDAAYETDIVESLLENARKGGMKVFLGLNMDDRWWDLWWDAPRTLSAGDWLREQMRYGNRVADELYARYHARYPDTFYGWYWVWEFWNAKIMALGAAGRNQTIGLLADCLNITLDHVSELDASMPLLMSPFANMQLTADDDLYFMWRDILQRTHFREGDIFCPQDSVGAGGTKLQELRRCYRLYREACRQKPGLRFWANNESFIQGDWSSAPLDRFVSQLEITGEFAEKNITFSYNNYYSPLNVGKGFHRALKHYLDTGVLSDEMPPEPRAVQMHRGDGRAELTWKSGGDVAGYVVYKNEKSFHAVNLERNDGTGHAPRVVCAFTDEESAPGDRYSVAARSYEGNLSLPCDAMPVQAAEGLTEDAG